MAPDSIGPEKSILTHRQQLDRKISKFHIIRARTRRFLVADSTCASQLGSPLLYLLASRDPFLILIQPPTFKGEMQGVRVLLGQG